MQGFRQKCNHQELKFFINVEKAFLARQHNERTIFSDHVMVMSTIVVKMCSESNGERITVKSSSAIFFIHCHYFLAKK